MIPTIYLDTSALTKRYISEKGTETIDLIFDSSEIEKSRIVFSIWNIGESIGVFDKYYRRKLITEDGFKESIRKMFMEIQKLYKLKTLKLISLDSNILIETFPLILKYHLYQADVLQIISFKVGKCDVFLSADKKLVEIMKTYNENTFNIETEGRLFQKTIEF